MMCDIVLQGSQTDGYGEVLSISIENSTLLGKVMQVGNGVTDDYLDFVGTFDYWWTHGLISDSTYRILRIACDFGSSQHPSVQCMQALKVAVTVQGNIDPHSIYTPPCNDTASLRRSLNSRYPWMSRAYDPCTEMKCMVLCITIVQKFKRHFMPM